MPKHTHLFNSVFQFSSMFFSFPENSKLVFQFSPPINRGKTSKLEKSTLKGLKNRVIRKFSFPVFQRTKNHDRY